MEAAFYTMEYYGWKEHWNRRKSTSFVPWTVKLYFTLVTSVGFVIATWAALWQFNSCLHTVLTITYFTASCLHLLMLAEVAHASEFFCHINVDLAQFKSVLLKVQQNTIPPPIFFCKHTVPGSKMNMLSVLQLLMREETWWQVSWRACCSFAVEAQST